MTNDLATITISNIETMAKAIAASNLFGVKTPDQAMALMLIAHAEGRHPALAARDYDIIQGKPAKKSEAMLRDFLQAGGKVEWHVLTDAEADASFSHPDGGSIRISWDMNRAKAAGLAGKDMWKKFPRAMLRARLVSEGIRTVCPMATSGMYVPEEINDIEDNPKEKPQPTIEGKAVVVERTKPKDKTLPDLAKEIAIEVNLADTPEKLDALLKHHAETMKQLSEKLPSWAERLKAVVEKQRAIFPENAPTYDDMNQEVPI